VPCWNSNQYEERTDRGVCKIEEKKAGNRNMDEMQRPIGVFDSGVGGISVLRELVALMPNENFIFYGDSKNAPYGTKTLEEVRKLTLADAEYLRSRNVKALVVACNTATSAAIHILRERYQKEIPVIHFRLNKFTFPFSDFFPVYAFIVQKAISLVYDFPELVKVSYRIIGILFLPNAGGQPTQASKK